MKRMAGHFLALLLLTAACVQAQTEAALKMYFEGRKAELKIDMPGSVEGVELYPKAQPVFNPKRYKSKLLQLGSSMRRGDSFTFTEVRVTEKNIEFQLRGADYGIVQDGARPTPSTIAIPRERQSFGRHVLGNGRFTLWYPDKSLKTTIPEPTELERILSDYVEFSGRSIGHIQISPRPSEAASKLKKGMTESDVLRLLGAPRQSREHQEGELTVVTNTFFSEDESIEVDFVKGSVVNYRIRPR
jgi:hypothetical protein